MNDPTLEELMECLRGEDEFDRAAAIYWFAHDYHSGQWSNLYSVLSTSKFKPGLTHSSIKDEGENAEDLYNMLVAKYGE